MEVWGVVLNSSLLFEVEGRLELRVPSEDGHGPVRAEFVEGRVGWRLRHAGRSQAIGKAVGLKKGKPLPSVVDATAGLGRDSALLAVLGCNVIAFERSPEIHALLVDGLRSAADSDLGPLLQERISTRLGDSIEELPTVSPAPDVVLIDPMHPNRRSKARVRKEMRALRAVVGEDCDAEDLVAVALSCAKNRVVVKRPAKAAPLTLTPSFQVEGKTVRFDVYLRES